MLKPSVGRGEGVLSLIYGVYLYVARFFYANKRRLISEYVNRDLPILLFEQHFTEKE